MIPGQIVVSGDPIELNAGRAEVELVVQNTGDRPVQVGSHFHFAEVNPALQFDRLLARGCHLAIPAGTSVRFEPGLDRTVRLVPYTGARVAAGFRSEVAGPLDPPPAPGLPPAAGERP